MTELNVLQYWNLYGNVKRKKTKQNEEVCELRQIEHQAFHNFAHRHAKEQQILREAAQRTRARLLRVGLPAPVFFEPIEIDSNSSLGPDECGGTARAERERRGRGEGGVAR